MVLSALGFGLSLEPCLHYSNPDWVMNLPLLFGAAGFALPFLVPPQIPEFVARRRQRRFGARLEEATARKAKKRGAVVETEPRGLGAVRISVTVEKLPEELWMAAEGSREKGHRLGDRELDEAVRFWGDRAVALVHLTPAVRSELLAFMRLEPGLQVRDGRLLLDVSLGEGADAAIRATLAMVELGRNLAKRPSGSPLARLLLRYRSETDDAVRDAILDELIERYRYAPDVVELVRELLDGGTLSLNRALEVARAAELAEEVARLEAEIASGAGRLAVSDEPDHSGGLAMSEEAPEGALSRPRPKVKQ